MEKHNDYAGYKYLVNADKLKNINIIKCMIYTCGLTSEHIKNGTYFIYNKFGLRLGCEKHIEDHNGLQIRDIRIKKHQSYGTPYKNFPGQYTDMKLGNFENKMDFIKVITYKFIVQDGHTFSVMLYDKDKQKLILYIDGELTTDY